MTSVGLHCGFHLHCTTLKFAVLRAFVCCQELETEDPEQLRGHSSFCNKVRQGCVTCQGLSLCALMFAPCDDWDAVGEDYVTELQLVCHHVVADRRLLQAR